MNINCCPMTGFCSGCTHRRSVLKEALCFFHNQQLSGYMLCEGSPTGWRTRAKLAVRNQDGRLVCGLFRGGSHEVVPLVRCPAHHSSINTALGFLSSIPVKWAYFERENRGLLRYVQLEVERATGRVRCSLVLNLQNFEGSEVAMFERWASECVQKEPSLWHSFWINLQHKSTNTIFGSKWKLLWGPKFLKEKICGTEIPLLPSHFSQANPEMFEVLLQDLLTLCPKDTRVAELYAGMGVIGCIVSPISSTVRLIERDRSAEESFNEIRSRLEHPERVEYVVGDAEQSDEALLGAQTVIVDPPRKGLSRELIQKIRSERSIKDLFYISCHFPTLERDALQIVSGEEFKIVFARSYLFFPGTDHIETLVRFERSG